LAFLLFGIAHGNVIPTISKPLFNYLADDKNLGPSHWYNLPYVNFSSPDNSTFRYQVINPSVATSCAGNRQSPINIVDADAEYNSSLKLLMFHGENTTIPLAYENLGTTAEVEVESREEVFLTGGRTDPSGTYHVLQFHFHINSEHTFDGFYAGLELHIVVANVKSASDLHAIGIQFIEGAENEALKNVTDSLANIPEFGTSTWVAEVDLNGLLPANQFYYSYLGSLTTPPCSEVVTWYVFYPPQTMSGAQIQAFQKTYLTSPYLAPLGLNNRPTQAIDYTLRPVSYFSTEFSAASVTSVGSPFVSLFALVLMIFTLV